MPTYQYACTHCDHRFEAVQSFSEPNLTQCPECPGVVRKVFSAVGVVFKGSGFYRTDSRDKTAKSPAKTDKQRSEKSGSVSATAAPDNSSTSTASSSSSGTKSNSSTAKTATPSTSGNS